MKHTHHLKPRHLGGTDDPVNLLEVTVEEHALIHFAHWIAYGRWQDKAAYIGLSKMEGYEEQIRQALSEATSRAMKGNKNAKGSVRTEKFKDNLSDKMKGNSRGFKKKSVPWNKGLSKTSDPRVAQMAAATSKGRTGLIIKRSSI